MKSFYSGSERERRGDIFSLSRACGFLATLLLGLGIGLSAAEPVVAQVSDKPLFLTGRGLPPNLLLIIDSSDSMQEGLSQGRVALDWDTCVPGPAMNATDCPAGAKYIDSKASIVKRVALRLAEQYRGQVNLGLMSYQQNAPSLKPVDALTGNRTALWRLAHRPLDVRFSTQSNPTWYNPLHNEPWDSEIKRFRERHPTQSNLWVFYNVGITGFRPENTSFEGIPSTDETRFCRFNGNNPSAASEPFSYHCWTDWARFQSGSTTGRSTTNFFLTDSMRQRGVTHFGTEFLLTQLNQLEWRSGSSPGLGYLHLPLLGNDASVEARNAHWQVLRNKLQTQRHDWDRTTNVMIDPSWPLIASGLTPLEGTMRTARDYFLGAAAFNSAQGKKDDTPPVPLSCGVNAALWLTDGLPSVKADGTALGNNPVSAINSAALAVKDFYDETEKKFGKGVQTYIVGFALPPGVGRLFDATNFPTGPLGKLAQAGGTDRAYSAENEAELEDVINGLFTRIVQQSGSSAASVAANSTSLQEGTAIYQASFDSRDWSGEVAALRVRPPVEPSTSIIDSSPAWTASSKLPPHASRNLITWVPTNPVPSGIQPAASGVTKAFTFANLNTTQQAALNRNPDTGAIDNRGADRLGWLRGNQQHEGITSTTFRMRNKLLGDIVYSRPLYVHAQNFGYHALSVGGNDYPKFLRDLAGTTPLLTVAANDGKLHFFDARLPCTDGNTASTGGCSPSGGTELFAYIPNAVIPELNKLTSQNHARDRKFVFDGSPRLGHVYDATTAKWRRVVVGSLGRGGKAAFAIDVDSRTVLWELNTTHTNNLGTAIGEPVLGRAPNGRWITIIPNGPGSTDGRASLLILDTLTGEVLLQWVPSNAANAAGSGNGMFTPVAVDVTGDRHIDRVYAGDIRGNLWRLDLDGSSGTNQWRAPSSLRSGNTDLPLFQARSGNQIQPITVRPAVTRDDAGRLVVLFGTGKYYESGDDRTTGQQSFYGLIDNDTGTIPRSTLQTQQVLGTDERFGFELRGTTNATVGNTQRGWVMDLPDLGERVVEDAIIREGNRVVFPTLIPLPSSDPCKPGGGTGYLMEMNALSGSRLTESPFDISGKGFGEESFISILVDGEMVSMPASGLRRKDSQEILTRPAVIADPQFRDREYKISATSSGGLVEIIEQRVGAGRKSWRQLR